MLYALGHCIASSYNTSILVLVIDMSTEFNLVIFFLPFFRIIKSEMSHVAEKVRGQFLLTGRSCNIYH